MRSLNILCGGYCRVPHLGYTASSLTIIVIIIQLKNSVWKIYFTLRASELFASIVCLSQFIWNAKLNTIQSPHPRTHTSHPNSGYLFARTLFFSKLFRDVCVPTTTTTVAVTKKIVNKRKTVSVKINWFSVCHWTRARIRFIIFIFSIFLCRRALECIRKKTHTAILHNCIETNIE